MIREYDARDGRILRLRESSERLMSRFLRVFGVAWLLAGMLPSTAQAQSVAPAVQANVEPDALAAPAPLSEVVVEAPEPKYVAPTLRDRIGRIWAPVWIDGKGPFRLVLDTGASRSAVTAHVAQSLWGAPVAPLSATPISIHLNGVTGSAIVPGVQVDKMEVGELEIDSTTLPIVADAFGGAEGVLGREGLLDKRIVADFIKDRLTISRSHKERARFGFTTLPVKLTQAGLLAANVHIGTMRVRAIIDTGAQQTVGNMMLKRALMRRSPSDAREEDIIGVTQESQRGTNTGIPPLVFGELRIQGIRVTFADTYLFELMKLDDEPTVLVGMDVLGLFDTLIIDYKLREIQIRARHSYSSEPRHPHLNSEAIARNFH